MSLVSRAETKKDWNNKPKGLVSMLTHLEAASRRWCFTRTSYWKHFIPGAQGLGGAMEGFELRRDAIMWIRVHKIGSSMMIFTSSVPYPRNPLPFGLFINIERQALHISDYEQTTIYMANIPLHFFGEIWRWRNNIIFNNFRDFESLVLERIISGFSMGTL